MEIKVVLKVFGKRLVVAYRKKYLGKVEVKCWVAGGRDLEILELRPVEHTYLVFTYIDILN